MTKYVITEFLAAEIEKLREVAAKHRKAAEGGKRAALETRIVKLQVKLAALPVEETNSHALELASKADVKADEIANQLTLLEKFKAGAGVVSTDGNIVMALVGKKMFPVDADGTLIKD